MKEIKANKILFIKLGERGDWEKNAITEENFIKIGFTDADFNSCINGDWKKIEDYYLNKRKISNIATTQFITQLKYFFEEDENTIWITFYNNKLWWGKAYKDVILQDDQTKIRRILGEWSDKDINGILLTQENISGRIWKVQGYRGTICTVEDPEYLLNRINGKQSEKVTDTFKNLELLKKNISDLIKDLQWKDFEILIDLIFRQAGFQRITSIGKTEKTIDLNLYQPLTKEKCLVQIKSKSNYKEFEEYSSKFLDMNDYSKFFFVVHTTTDSNFKSSFESTDKIKLFLVEDIAELIINLGLIKWIIDKSL